MKKTFLRVFLLFSLTFLFFLSFSTVMPIVKLSDKKSSQKFSAYRALKHVKEISKKPHYTGSDEHSRVRNYIVNELQDIGLIVHTQSGDVINDANVMTSAENIVTVIPGSDPQPRSDLLVLAHYDSEPHSSFGASDDGTSVAAILEALRTLKENETDFKNNIVIALTDAEEIGLLGAQLFAEQHPLVKNIGLILNFEARGTSGPSNTILETNYGNANLIRGYAKANPHFPMASSLMYEIYKNMPNDTDATVFREDLDIPSFFFAYIDGHYNYHTAQDNYANVDRNSLAHQGYYLMDLIPYFGNVNLADFKTDKNQIYFNFPFFRFIHYSYDLIIPLLSLSWILFAALLIWGFKKRKLQLSEIGAGAFAFLGSLLLVGGFGWLGWKAVLTIYPQYQEIQQGFPYNGHYYIVGFAFIGLAIALGVYYFLGKDREKSNLIIFPLFFWLIINSVLAFVFKGASYFIFPTIFLELALALLLWRAKSWNILLLTFVIPAIFIFAPLIVYIPVALGMKTLFAGLVLMILVFGLLLPVLPVLFRVKWPAYLFVLSGIVFLFMANARSSFSESRPRPNSLVYILDRDSNEAKWKSYDEVLDSWTEQKIGSNNKQLKSASIMPSKYGSGFLYEQKAEVKDIPGVEVKVSRKVSDSGYSAYELKIYPKRDMQRLILFSLDNEIEYQNLRFNNVPSKSDGNLNSAMYKSYQKDKKRLLTYYAVERDTLRVDFNLPSNKYPKLELYGASYDLFDNPWLNVKPREIDMMPRPFTLNDAIITKQEIRLD